MCNEPGAGKSSVHIGICVGLLISVAPQTALAQACCTATGNTDVGVVQPGARAALALQASWEHAAFSYAADGKQRALKNARADDWVLSLGGGVRPFEPLALHAAAPLRLQRRRLGDDTAQNAVHPGDAVVGARYLVAHDPLPAHGAVRLSQLEIATFAKLPTGRDATESETSSGVDATGDGVLQLGLGIEGAVRLPRVHWLDAGVGYAARLPKDAAGRRLDPGDELTLRAGYAWVPDVFLALGAGVSYRGTLAAKEDGIEIPASQTRRIRATIFARHTLRHPVWHLITSLSSDLPMNSFGKNVPYAGSTLSLSVQRTWVK
jgi:hypothetical protein